MAGAAVATSAGRPSAAATASAGTVATCVSRVTVRLFIAGGYLFPATVAEALTPLLFLLLLLQLLLLRLLRCVLQLPRTRSPPLSPSRSAPVLRLVRVETLVAGVRLLSVRANVPPLRPFLPATTTASATTFPFMLLSRARHPVTTGTPPNTAAAVSTSPLPVPSPTTPPCRIVPVIVSPALLRPAG